MSGKKRRKIFFTPPSYLEWALKRKGGCAARPIIGAVIKGELGPFGDGLIRDENDVRDVIDGRKGRKEVGRRAVVDIPSDSSLVAGIDGVGRCVTWGNQVLKTVGVFPIDPFSLPELACIFGDKFHFLEVARCENAPAKDRVDIPDDHIGNWKGEDFSAKVGAEPNLLFWEFLFGVEFFTLPDKIG